MEVAERDAFACESWEPRFGTGPLFATTFGAHWIFPEIKPERDPEVGEHGCVLPSASPPPDFLPATFSA